MRAVVQRVKRAKVLINDGVYTEIKQGFLVYLGISDSDTIDEVNKLAHKISNLRVFEDEEGKMNLNLNHVSGEILVVSQFTLHADMKRGHRPSFIKAARPEVAIPLYEAFIKQLRKNHEVKEGIFGANMDIASVNSGPVTLIYETEEL